MKKKALIIGISGQDGIYLSKILLSKNYNVYGITRGNKKNLIKSNLINKLKLFILKDLKEKNFLPVLRKYYDEIYFLGGQSNVKKSYYLQEETYKSQIEPVKIILEFIRKQKKKSKFLFAASSDMYGQKKTKKKVKEVDDKSPISPYAMSKLICFEIIKTYRNMFNLPVCSAILFNHESKYRNKDYVFPKILRMVERISKNKKLKIQLGNINIKRDWGWAPEYMYGCYKIINSKNIEDYNIATGSSTSLKNVISLAFKEKNLNYKNYLKIDKKFIRQFEISENYADISKIKKKLKWHPHIKYKQIINKLFEYGK